MSAKQLASLLLGLILGAAALYLLFRDVTLAKVLLAVEQTNTFTISAVCFLSLLTIYLRGLRWRLILPDEPGAHTRGLGGLTAVYFMLNNILPARMGEAARVYLLCRQNKYSLHASIGTALVDRLIDTFFFSAVLAAPSFFLDLGNAKVLGKIPASYFSDTGLMICGGIAVVFLLLFLVPPKLLVRGVIAVLFCLVFLPLIFLSGLILWWTIFGVVVAIALLALFTFLFPSWLKAFKNFLEHTVKTLELATRWRRDWRRTAGVILLSLPIIASYMLSLRLLSGSLGFTLSWPGAALTEGLIAVGVALPAAPGFVGTLHLMCREGLVLSGAAPEVATAVAVLYHVLNWLPTVGAGVFFYFKMNLRGGQGNPPQS